MTVIERWTVPYIATLTVLPTQQDRPQRPCVLLYPVVTASDLFIVSIFLPNWTLSLNYYIIWTFEDVCLENKQVNLKSPENWPLCRCHLKYVSPLRCHVRLRYVTDTIPYKIAPANSSYWKKQYVWIRLLIMEELHIVLSDNAQHSGWNYWWLRKRNLYRVNNTALQKICKWTLHVSYPYIYIYINIYMWVCIYPHWLTAHNTTIFIRTDLRSPNQAYILSFIFLLWRRMQQFSLGY